ncbi:NUMOD4 domain-containing protein [Paenibacillus graminis]|uniref:NUMOD4 domain-containing protein n=1 Tax=Paenibacillus graminis TaxID=189425 RepID=UPI002DB6764D|nr:NUMOD4 domain-containing protein [Paenibacillus graminis]MEC0167906.1 NUMOD4 domain-containing protein [Paenibacillus graminis]
MYNHTDYCLPGETWKPIPDYEGIYEASDLGRIRSVDGKVTDSVRHGRRVWRGRILKTRGNNYTTGHRVSLWRDKVSRDYLVARLVGITFLGVPDDPEMTINHIDGNRFNNQVANLEWLSLADNIRHAFSTGLMPHAQKIKLLSNSTVYEFDSLSKASAFLGRNEKYISSCLIRGVPIRDENGEIAERIA